VLARTLSNRSPTSDTQKPKIAVRLVGEVQYDARAHALSTELGLPLTADSSGDYSLTLAYGPPGLSLTDHRTRRRKIWIDFTAHASTRRGARLTRRDPLGRAVGRTARTLVDATAGLCADAMRLACFGLSVLAIERVAAIYAMVRDAHERARETPPLADCASRLRLAHGDARHLLPALTPAPNIVYIDPMFPPKRRRSAAARKELVLIRELAGDDPDAAQLLSLSRRIATERVIVKRPNDQPPLAPDPTVSYGGKLVRYDVYRTDLS